MSDYLAPSGNPVDKVAVRGIRGRGTHGVLAAEKRDGQEFSCDVVLHVPTLRAGRSDDLTDAVDYSVVAEQVHAILIGQSLDLLEALAQRVATAVLADPRLLAVDVTIHKPHAPIGVPFDDVIVQVRRSRDDMRVDHDPVEPLRAVLALGANLGERHQTLSAAVRALAATAGIDVALSSPVVESSPVGGPPQGNYLNAVVLIDTTLSARALLHACQDIEQSHGRTRDVHWGPRTLDIDVITYGDLAVDTQDLRLPHPAAALRPFVLLPWSLVDPDAQLQEHGFATPIAALLEDPFSPIDEVVLRRELTLPHQGTGG